MNNDFLEIIANRKSPYTIYYNILYYSLFSSNKTKLQNTHFLSPKHYKYKHILHIIRTSLTLVLFIETVGTVIDGYGPGKHMLG